MTDKADRLILSITRIADAACVEAFALDRPRDGTELGDGETLLGGWVLGKGWNPTQIIVRDQASGRIVGQGFCLPRPDVAKKFDYLNPPVTTGFRIAIQRVEFAPGRALQVEARDEYGNVAPLLLIVARHRLTRSPIIRAVREKASVIGKARPSWQVTFSVWYALFLSEMVARMFGRRAAWVWILLDPVMHMVFTMFLFSMVQMRVVDGIDTAVWIMTGLLGYFMFNRSVRQAMNAVVANRALFTYRQVRPVDTVIVRAALEGFLTALISMLLLAGSALAGLQVIPTDPMKVLAAGFGLWMLGLGLGLICSVAVTLVGEFGRLIDLAFTPLYFISGVMFPVSSVPPPYRDWILLNPVLHGVDAIRSGFAPYYHALPEQSLTYLYGMALVMVFLGLALHVRYSLRLATS